MKRKYRIILIGFAAFGMLVGLGGLLSVRYIRAQFSEAAFSLCGREIESGNADALCGYLTFTDLSETEKQLLLSAVEAGDPALSEIAEDLRYFSYSLSSVRALREKIGRALADFAPVISLTEDQGRYADDLVKELFGRSVHFSVERENGEIARRYICGNVGVTAYSDGSVVMVNDLRSPYIGRKLMAYLIGKEKMGFRTENFHGIYGERIFYGKNGNASLFFDRRTGSLIAAKIAFNS